MITERGLYSWLLYAFIALAGVTFVLLQVLTAPYGRHTRAGWGPRVNATLGWVLMEAPSPVVFALCAALGHARVTLASGVFALLWEGHYVYRAFVFPFRRRGGDNVMPVAIAASGFAFNLGNAYLNGRYLYHFGPDYSAAWLADPRFVLGVVFFAAGLAINHHADHVLRELRRPGETGYKIPHGGLYRWVSAPNYFGELVEWAGWALCTWSLPGLVFLVWSAANLVPRARANHRWYREKFADYPPERRALVPWLF